MRLRLHFGKSFLTLLAYVVAAVMFFPIFWLVLTAFKTEQQAFSTPPQLLFAPTLATLREVFSRGTFLIALSHTIELALGSTILGLILALPAAYILTFYPTRGTGFTLLWMISTRMLPPAGVLVPIYIIYRDLHLLDTVSGLLIIDVCMNLPLIVWMLYTFFHDIPIEIFEAARIDGANIWQELVWLLLPLARPGIVAAALLAIIFSWNESFWTINLASSHATTLPFFVASFKTSEGLFWAKMSAAASLAILPIIFLGWFAQRQLVRGLSFGAVK